MGLHQLLGGLRDDLGRRSHVDAFHSRRAGADLLSEFSTVDAVLRALDEDHRESFELREGLLRELLSQHRQAASREIRSMWGSALAIAFAPMLHATGGRIRSKAFSPDDLDQLVIEGFLDALDRCPLDARIVCRRIHLGTRRFVIRAVLAEHRRIAIRARLADEAKRDMGFVPFEWRTKPVPLDDDERVELEALLRSLVGDAVAEPRLATVIRTRIESGNARSPIPLGRKQSTGSPGWTRGPRPGRRHASTSASSASGPGRSPRGPRKPVQREIIGDFCRCSNRLMVRFFLFIVVWSLRAALRSRGSVALENLALRQQLATYARAQKRP